MGPARGGKDKRSLNASYQDCLEGIKEVKICSFACCENCSCSMMLIDVVAKLVIF